MDSWTVFLALLLVFMMSSGAAAVSYNGRNPTLLIGSVLVVVILGFILFLGWGTKERVGDGTPIKAENLPLGTYEVLNPAQLEGGRYVSNVRSTDTGKVKSAFFKEKPANFIVERRGVKGLWKKHLVPNRGTEK